MPRSYSAALPIAYVVLADPHRPELADRRGDPRLAARHAQRAMDHERVQALAVARRGAADHGACARSPCSASSRSRSTMSSSRGCSRSSRRCARATRSSPRTRSRLQAIAWALLALQLLSLVIGAIGKARFDAGASGASRCRLFDQRLAGGAAHLRAGPRVRRRHADARRPRRDGVTWRSPSSSTICSTTGG